MDEQKMLAIPDKVPDTSPDNVPVSCTAESAGNEDTATLFTPPRTKRVATAATPGAAFITPEKQAKKSNDLAMWKSTANPEGPHAQGHLGPSGLGLGLGIWEKGNGK